MTDLTTIEALTKDYATARDLLAERLQSLNDEVEALKRRRMTGLKSAVRSMATAQDKLYSSIKGNPELFMKPRTLVIQGIKVGMAKGKGKICIDDPAMAIKLMVTCSPVDISWSHSRLCGASLTWNASCSS